MAWKLPKNADKLLPWIDANGMKTSEGSPFEWHNHLFLIDPLCDWHPTQGWNKAAQMGASECVSLKAAFMAQELKLSGIYVLPSDSFVESFVPKKFDPILSKNKGAFPVVSGGTMMKQFGQDDEATFITFKGGHLSLKETEAAATSKGVADTAHWVIYDERSKQHPLVVEQMQSRLLNSPYKFSFSFDNPTFPNAGADKIFRESDQREYAIKCSHCGWKQFLKWIKLSATSHIKAEHTYVDDGNYYLVCGKCAKPLTDEDRRVGEWVATRPSQASQTDDVEPWGKRGYHFSQLMYVHHSIRFLLEQEADKSTQYFNNMILGLPYIGSEVSFTPDIMKSNFVNRPKDKQPVIGEVAMGVDQGNEKQYFLRDRHGLFGWGRTESWEEIEMIFNQWKAVAVADAMPQVGAVKRLCKKYPGRFFRCSFGTESDQAGIVKFGTSTDRSLVLVKRNEFFDEMHERYLQFAAPINIPINDGQEIVKEFSNLARTISTDSRGNERAEWVKLDNHVDLPFADMYSWIALSRIPDGALSKVQSYNNHVALPVREQGLIPTPESIIKSLRKR
jgi:DNA-directed RNA polymerase subunit RPC12/RpoP